MKTISCAQIGGGTCAFSVTAATSEDAKQQFMAHAKEAHADMVAAATPESMATWNTMFDGVWAGTPEAAA